MMQTSQEEEFEAERDRARETLNSAVEEERVRGKVRSYVLG